MCLRKVGASFVLELVCQTIVDYTEHFLPNNFEVITVEWSQDSTPDHFMNEP